MDLLFPSYALIILPESHSDILVEVDTEHSDSADGGEFVYRKVAPGYSSAMDYDNPDFVFPSVSNRVRVDTTKVLLHGFRGPVENNNTGIVKRCHS